MPAKNNHIKIGIFVLVAIALLIAGLLAFGARSYFSSKTHFETAIVGDVAGLSVGSVVQFRGVPVGKVSQITFAWNQYPESKTKHIIVDFDVEGDLFPLPPGTDIEKVLAEAISQGLRAAVKGQGITGTSLLAVEVIKPAPAPPEIDYKPKFHYIPSTPSQFTRMLESLEKSLDHFEQLDFAGISQGVTNALGGLRLIEEKLDKLDLQAVATNANVALIEVKNVAVMLTGMVAQVQETIKGMKLDTLSQDADGLVRGLGESNVKLQTVLVKLGTMPLQDTVVDLRQALQTLNEVLLEMKRYPSGFFLGEPPPPVKGMSPPRQSK
jgi:ABC-type transporter Mla subunit MlaD